MIPTTNTFCQKYRNEFKVVTETRHANITKDWIIPGMKGKKDIEQGIIESLAQE